MSRKSVLFIPGFPASELRDANTGATIYPPSLQTLLSAAAKKRFLDRITAVPGDLLPGPPIRDILGIAKQAQALYDLLSGKFGYDTSDLSPEFAAIGWDWRLSIADVGVMTAIGDAVNRLPGKIVAMVHSTGGLVFRAFLDSRPDLVPRFEQVVSFGVPWAGTPTALQAMTTGQSAGFLFAKISAAESARIVSHAQAAYELLPADVINDPMWIPPVPALAAAARPLPPRQFNLLPVTNICGWGYDGDDSGDGTVPFASSSWIQGANVRTMFLPIGAYATANIPYPHSRIWDSPPVLQLLEEVLNDATRAPFLCAAADGNDYIDYNADVDVRFSAVGPTGGRLPGCAVSVELNGSKTPVAINPEGRGAFILKRAGITHNVGNDIYRFNVIFRWAGGGAVKRAVLIKSV